MRSNAILASLTLWMPAFCLLLFTCNMPRRSTRVHSMMARSTSSRVSRASVGPVRKHWKVSCETSSSKRPKLETTAVTPTTLSATKSQKVVSTFGSAAEELPRNKEVKTSAATLSAMPMADTGAIRPEQSWCDLRVPPSELRCSATLTNGQCFHWTALSADRSMNVTSAGNDKESAWGTHNAVEWIGIMRRRVSTSSSGVSVVLTMRETPTTTLYRALATQFNDETRVQLTDRELDELVRGYFHLDTTPTLGDLYATWSTQCSRLAAIANCLPGVRVLDQDPWECLVSFLCSSNNNIPRITGMLHRIRATYGDPILRLGNSVTLYSFPSLTTLAARATESDLRGKCGMGYRAKYLMETMQTLQQLGGEDYLHDLRSISDSQQVQETLLQFCGVGRKVADCVALFSLRQDDAIPVDVHVWNIARRDYNRSLNNAMASLTPRHYQQVANVFRDRFPVKSGWAHSLLFVAELPSFRPALPADMLEQMEQFRKHEQEDKAAKRKEKQI